MKLNLPIPVAAEQALLGGCLIDGTGIPCRPEDFGTEDHRAIAAAIVAIERTNEPISLITVAQHLSGKISSTYLAELVGSSGGAENADAYGRIVSESARARLMMAGAVEFLGKMNGRTAGSDLRSIVSEYGAGILRLSDTSGDKRDSSIGDALRGWIPQFEERVRAGRQMVGLSTGITKLDLTTCGMCGQELWILAARPSFGKTALSLQICRNVAGDGRHVLYFSLEMSGRGLIERFVARDARVNLAKVRSGNVNGSDFQVILEKAGELSSMPLTISDTPATELDILRKTRRYKPDLVVIDYLQKIRPAKPSQSKNHDYGEITKLLKDMAKELEIPVLLLSQLTRSNVKENRRPQDSDLRESGDIEQEADVIVFLHCQDKSEFKREIIVSKNRQGECGRWDMAFDGAYQTFEEM